MTDYQSGERLTAASLNGRFAGTAPASFAATGATRTRNIADRFADAANVFDFAAPDNTGVADSSAAIKAAHDAAAAAGYRYLYFPRGTYRAPTLASCGNVIFIGPGVLTGAYRKTIFPERTETRPMLRSDVAPSRHLAALNAAAAVASPSSPMKIALIGDSTTTFASASLKSEWFEELLRIRIAAEFPGVPFTIGNFGIGGQAWNQANGIASSFPGWYTDHTKPWLYYVQQFAPHAIFTNFGMNDGAQNVWDPTNLRGAVATMAAFSPTPDIVFCINVVPTLMQPGYQEKTAQEGRELVADYQRSYAQRHNHGLIDFGNAFNLARDGFDRATSPMLDVQTGVSASVPYTLPAECRDWGIGVNFPGGLNSMWSHGKLQVQIGSRGDNLLILEKDSGTGCIAYTVNLSASLNTISRTVTSFATGGGGDAFFDIVQKGPQLMVLVNGIRLFDAAVERLGGLYTPTITWDSGTTLACTISYAGIGVPALSMPTSTDFEMYGDVANNTNPAAPGYPYASLYGGGGLNHMSSIGIQRAMGAAFNATRLST